MMNAKKLIDKRKDLWAADHDIEKDQEFVQAIAHYLLSPEGDSLRKEIQDHPEYLIEMAFIIVDKLQETVPFFINDVQAEFLATLKQAIEDFKAGIRLHLKFLVLKGRQQGFTSIITAYQLACSITQKNFAGFTLADDQDNTFTIFSDKAKYPYDNLPEALKPVEKYNNRRELHFEKLNSRWRVATAGSKGVGRSKTLNFFHGSEVAFWDDLKGILTGLNPALTKDSIQILESTANGHNAFKDLWDDDNNWQGLFYEWWKTQEYRQAFENDEARASFQERVKNSQEQSDANSEQWVYHRCKWLLEFIGLEWEQIYWYYNQWKDYRNDIKQEYPCTADESFIASGDSVFDKEKIIARKEELKRNSPILKVGYFAFDYQNEKIIDRTIKWVDDPTGAITIFKEPKKVDGEGNFIQYPYVGGGDTAGDGSDFFAGHVLDNITGEQVAVLHHQYDEDLYARQMYCLGKHYNYALLSIEVNFSTYPVKELQRLGYARQYRREVMDEISNKRQHKYGFRTTTVTRPVIIAELVVVVRDHIELINDIKTLDEMLTFVKDENKKPVAQDGKRDDLVLGLAISHNAREQQSMRVITHQEDEPEYEVAFGNTGY
ncbi:hypothetical protein CVD25_01035 [Bacillus canaveralius]|uniref:Terminase n=1 Tax=Bacillus canaveralius TaxID=1403243 RepID=A0A2N5GPL7_9BACI|nr:hypothetical protein [Bacillus canaveralius]PLR84649.1 hypothetical protein CU635_06145 [Bacillus canaveralius]PLS00801.1 hypothetical protein CVD25_01035 [Bacillus canaveralius]